MERIEEIRELDEKRRHWPLLLLADPDRDMVMKYLPDGEMFVLTQDGEPVCEAVMSVRDDGQIELKNLATREDMQRKGFASRLVQFLFDHYRGRYDTMYVGTAHEGLYERWGFERAYVVKNFFIDNYPEPVIDEGGQCVDMIYYKRAL